MNSKNKSEEIEGIPQDSYTQTVKSLFLLARFYKDKYDALISVGFTKDQAFEIIKARGYNP